MTLVSGSNDPLLTLLERFNRKERFILFEQATTGIGRVGLADSYRKRLSTVLGVEIPQSDTLVLIDYHLNWLYAALELHAGTWSSDGEVKSLDTVSRADVPGPVPRTALERNQEDIDLLVAFEESGRAHIVLVEAKAHSGWTNKQMRSKATRFRAIFGEDGTDYPGVVPHFALTSYAHPSGISTDGWPAWMLVGGKVAHVDLETPTVPRLTVGETDAHGSPLAGGGYYAVRE